MKTNLGKKSVILYLILAGPILYILSKVLFFVGYGFSVSILFWVIVAGIILSSAIFACSEKLAYKKREKMIFAAYILGGAALTALVLYFSRYSIRDYRMANHIGVSAPSNPLQISLFALLFIICGIVAGILCRQYEEAFYWMKPLLLVCFGGAGVLLHFFDFETGRNIGGLFGAYYAMTILCEVLFCWTAWMTIQARQDGKIKLFVSIKAVLCTALIVVLFLPSGYGLVKVGGKCNYDTSRRDEADSDIEQMQVFLKQSTNGQGNAGILGWDIDNPETWDGVVFDGGDIVSIDLNGRGIGGKMELIYFDKLVVLDVSDNPELYELDCSYNRIETLDVSGCTKLRTLNCGGNRLKTIDVSGNINLKRFSCRGNLLTSLDVSKNTKLIELYCYDNNISEINLYRNKYIVILYCGGNPISSLDVSGNEKLTTLNCDDSENLASIDVRGCFGLTYLHCWNTKVRVVNINGVEGYTKLLFDYNQGYVANRKSTEKQMILIAIIIAVHVLADIGVLLLSKRQRMEYDGGIEGTDTDEPMPSTTDEKSSASFTNKLWKSKTIRIISCVMYGIGVIVVLGLVAMFVAALVFAPGEINIFLIIWAWYGLGVCAVPITLYARQYIKFTI